MSSDARVFGESFFFSRPFVSILTRMILSKGEMLLYIGAFHRVLERSVQRVMLEGCFHQELHLILP